MRTLREEMARSETGMEVQRNFGIMRGSSRNTDRGRGLEPSGFPLGETGVVTIRGRKAAKIVMTGEQR